MPNNNTSNKYKITSIIKTSPEIINKSDSRFAMRYFKFSCKNLPFKHLSQSYIEIIRAINDSDAWLNELHYKLDEFDGISKFELVE